MYYCSRHIVRALQCESRHKTSLCWWLRPGEGTPELNMLKTQQRVTMTSRNSGNTLIHREGGGAGEEKDALVFQILI
jgi:hypothetical protein